MLQLSFFLVLLSFVFLVEVQSETGVTTRYWDCCKPSCSWDGVAKLSTGPVKSCSATDQVISTNEKSGCQGGTAYMCSDQQPWAVNSTFSYGFAAVKLAGQKDADWCCACYELTFTDGDAKGKKMIVQATNTGGDLGENHFDIASPGGGLGLFNGCTPQFNKPASELGDQQFGGGAVITQSQCNLWPEKLQKGCNWRFDWGLGSNPKMTWKKVSCPTELTSITGCVRSDN